MKRVDNLSYIIGGDYVFHNGDTLAQEEWLGQVYSNTPDLYEPAARLLNNDGTDEEMEDWFRMIELVYPGLIVYV